jgi:hypothetical protein
MPSAEPDSERVPLGHAKQPREKFDQFAKAEITKRGEHADDHCEQDQLDILELIDAQRE